MSAVEERVRAGGLLAPGRAGPRAAVRRARLGLPARPRRPPRAGRSRRCTSTTACATPPATTRRSARALCERLGVAARGRAAPAPPRGQPAGLGARRALRRGGAARARADAVVAAGHTATDQVETVLYRLAASPGRRALLGMPRARRPRSSGRCSASRARRPPRTAARAASPGARTPPTPRPTYARNRVRHELLPALREVHPAAEANVLRTLALLRDEAEVLDAVVAAARRPAGRRRGSRRCRPRSRGSRCRRSPTRAGGGSVGARADEILALGARGGTRRSTSAAGCGRSSSTGGCASTTARPRRRPRRCLPVPGRRRLRQRVALSRASRPSDGTLDADALGAASRCAPWRAGDRMRPLGLGGSRTLQDLFTDRKVPRERRRGRPGGASRRARSPGSRASPPASGSSPRPATRRAGSRCAWS